MEALLPSEIARLVLGYLEEEKCGEAAKCFLNSSPHLAEIRHISQKGRKYPTKVNGFSLKDVLEEYCTVHTIVQESISSMSEQPSGSMIECLRSLVRACQPVQVHINLHPHQGQNTLSNKSENTDSSSFSSRPRARKTNSHGQSVEGNDSAPCQQTVFSQILPDSSSNQTHQAVVSSNFSQSSQLAHQTSFMNNCGSQNLQLNQNSNSNVLVNQVELRIQDNNGLLSQAESSTNHKTNEISPADEYSSGNVDTFQEPCPLLTPAQLSVASQQVAQQAAQQATRSEFTPSLGENVSLPPSVSETMRRDFSKSEEPVRSYTVTKCFGSNIVILENDNNNPQQCVPTSSITPSNFTQVGEAPKSSRFKLPTPYKIIAPPEQLTETAVRTGMVTNIVEKLDGAMKARDDSQELGEGYNFSDDTVQSVINQVMEDPCFEQFLLEFLQIEQGGSYSSSDDSQKQSDVCGERRKQLRKKKYGSGSDMTKTSINTAGDADCTPSKVLSEKPLNTGYNFLPYGVTPAKIVIEGDTMTPMTKLLKSITSPSSENYLDPTQFASLIDIPGSAVKVKEQIIPQPSFNDGTLNIIQVPPTANIVFCKSNQQMAQYVNEEGVNTVYTDEVQIVPPTLPPGRKVPIKRVPPPSKQRKREPRPKKCLTRGGRKANGQMHPVTNEKPTEEESTVTLYAADGKDVSSTVSYSSSGDLPILVSEVSDEVAEPQPVDTKVIGGCETKLAQDEVSKEVSCQLNTVDQSKPSKQSEGGHQLETKPQPEVPHQSEIATQLEVTHQLVAVTQSEVAHKPETEDLPEPDVSQQSEPVAQSEMIRDTETENIITHEKGDSLQKDDVLQPVNSSVIRNTPGFTGPTRPYMKRTSLSTPRRRGSYIRALDFSTPTKENDQSIRRANTSPKNMQINALSPRTTGKSGKSGKTSKVITNLFKSPEYMMSLSSGFKNPAAITSTPAETSSRVESSALPKPSEAWDRVGGVGLILETDISPVKRGEPNCKKALRSWDADLRSLLGGSNLPPPPPPPPVPSRKRKNTQPAGKKKAPKKYKTTEKEENLKADDDSLNNTPEVANESECEMARLIENCLMNSSSEATSPTKQSGISGVQKLQSPLKLNRAASSIKESGESDLQTLPSPSKLERAISPTRKIESSDIKTLPSPPKPETATSPTKKNDLSGVQTLLSPPMSDAADIVSKMELDKSRVKEDTISVKEKKDESKIDKKSLSSNGSVQVNEKNCTKIDGPEPSASELSSNVPASQDQGVTQESNPNDKIQTPVPDPLVSAVNKSHVFQAAWKESFSFDTPVKDNMANIVPQTPRFSLDPSTASGEDTPRTKIIKALPFPIVQSAATPIPTVPPTPTIHATPTVSPNGPAYFQPASSALSLGSFTSAGSQSDNLESILIQECSRMEASGIRQVAKKPVMDEIVCNSSESDLEELGSAQVVELSSSSKQNKPPNEEVELHGCARLRCYKRKTKCLNPLVRETFPGLLNNSKHRAITSGDDTDDCLIISPKKIPSDQKTNILNSKYKSHQEALPPSSEGGNVNTSEAVSTASQVIGNIDGIKIEEALNMLHGSPEKKSSKLTEKCTTAILTSLKQKSVCKKSTTPMKSKSERVKTPSKTKAALDDSIEQSTDDESSDSSSSSSSSESDSSSSSSDESTPVKENTSSVKETTVSSDIKRSISVTAAIPSTSEQIIENSTECTSEVIQEEIPKEKEDSDQVFLNAEPVSISSQEPVQELTSEVKSIDESSSSANVGESDHPHKNEAVIEKIIENIEESIADQEKVKESETRDKLPIAGSTDSKNLVEAEEQTENSKVSVDLRSLVQTKDMGACEKYAKSRDLLLTNKSSVMSELQEKRLRTIAQLKGAIGRKETKRKGSSVPESSSKPEDLHSKTSLDSQETKKKGSTVPESSSKPEDLHSKTSLDSQETKKKGSSVPESSSKPEDLHSKTSLDSQKGPEGKLETITKDLAICKEVPKKCQSKSEVDGKICHEEPKDSIAKRRSLSDCAKGSSDDEEFKLHLSGDEKEEIELDSVEAVVQVSSQTNEILETNLVVASKSTVTKSQIVTPETRDKEGTSKSLNFVPKKVISKAADDVIKALLEKGFNCAVPPLPTEKIKKIDPNVKRKESEKKPVTVPSKPKHTPESVSSKSRPSKPIESATNVDECPDSFNEEMSETINTSITSCTREVTVKYSGLGPRKPKVDIFPIRTMQVEMDDFSVSLSLTKFLSLYNVNAVDSRVEAERRGHRSISNRTDSKTSNINPRYMHDQVSRDVREKGLQNRNSGDRGTRHRGSSSGERGGTRHREDNRSRSNQSPPHRYTHSKDYSNDRSHFRDLHGSRNSYDRSKRDSRQEENPSYHHHSHSNTRTSMKSNTKELSSDAEDGEILSSDSELCNRERSKRMRPDSQKKSVKGSRFAKESVSRRKDSKSVNPVENITSRKSAHHGIIVEPPEQKRSSSTIEVKVSRSGKVNHPIESDENTDVNLDDDSNFPVLGDDDIDEHGFKESEQNSSKESNSSGGMVLRRAPPRSVNAHKNATNETLTPTRRVKRKLSTSPDNISEDSCQSSLSAVNPESKQMLSSQRAKKRMSTIGKTAKHSENEDVANCSEIIKNLNVDAFLSKIHG